MAKANKMKLDIERLNQVKNGIAKEYENKEWIMLSAHEMASLIDLVCLRYSEEVNKNPDTKTAEDIEKLIQRLYDFNNMPHATGINPSAFRLGALAMHRSEISPLKKRIEELEVELRKAYSFRVS